MFIACSPSKKENEKNDKAAGVKTDSSKCLISFEISSRSHPDQYELEHFSSQMFIPSLDFKTAKGLWNFNGNDIRIDTLIPMLAVDTAEMKLYVNSAYFSDLVQVNVTGINDHHVIGSVKPALFKIMSLRKILTLLMHAGIMETYIHLNAEICLKEETESDDTYMAEFSAVHHYCTNDCYDEPYRFGLTINKKNGVIFVRPLLE